MTVKKGELVELSRPGLPIPSRRPRSVGLLASFNWPGMVCDTVGEILDYAKESKRSKVEEKRIDQEAAVRHHQIDALLHLKLEDQTQRSQHAREILVQSSVDRARVGADRQLIVAEISRLSRYITLPSTSTEDRRIAQETLVTLVQLLADQTQHSRDTFDRAVSATQAVLDPSSILESVKASLEV